jgi:hypothetical protein
MRGAVPKNGSPEYFLALAELCEEKASLSHFQSVRQILLDLAARWRAQVAQENSTDQQAASAG